MALRSVQHPLPLTIVILYSTALGSAFADFPPVQLPFQFSDLLLLATLTNFVGLILVTHSHGSVADTYEIKLFVLKALSALGFAWQFRLLDRVGLLLRDGASPSSTLLMYYLVYLGLIFAMVRFSRWTVPQMASHHRGQPGRYTATRLVGLVVMVVGAIVEVVAIPDLVRVCIRWGVGIALFVTCLTYFISQPWLRFQGPEPVPAEGDQSTPGASESAANSPSAKIA